MEQTESSAEVFSKYVSIPESETQMETYNSRVKVYGFLIYLFIYFLSTVDSQLFFGQLFFFFYQKNLYFIEPILF